MNNKEKIRLNKQVNILSFHREGLFYKCYNKDAMVFATRVKPYKVSVKQLKRDMKPNKIITWLIILAILILVPTVITAQQTIIGTFPGLAGQLESYRTMKKGNIAPDFSFGADVLAPDYGPADFPEKFSE